MWWICSTICTFAMQTRPIQMRWLWKLWTISGLSSARPIGDMHSSYSIRVRLCSRSPRRPAICSNKTLTMFFGAFDFSNGNSLHELTTWELIRYMYCILYNNEKQAIVIICSISIHIFIFVQRGKIKNLSESRYSFFLIISVLWLCYLVWVATGVDATTACMTHY